MPIIEENLYMSGVSGTAVNHSVGHVAAETMPYAAPAHTARKWIAVARPAGFAVQSVRYIPDLMRDPADANRVLVAHLVVNDADVVLYVDQHTSATTPTTVRVRPNTDDLDLNQIFTVEADPGDYEIAPIARLMRHTVEVVVEEHSDADLTWDFAQAWLNPRQLVGAPAIRFVGCPISGGVNEGDRLVGLIWCGGISLVLATDADPVPGRRLTVRARRPRGDELTRFIDPT